MRFLVVMLLVSMPLLCGCGNKHLPKPMPVYGIDIQDVKKGEATPFDGIVFSPFYLNEYLQWKDTTK